MYIYIYFSFGSNENNSISKGYSNVFLDSVSEELKESTSYETDGQTDLRKEFGTALVFLYQSNPSMPPLESPLGSQ